MNVEEMLRDCGIEGPGREPTKTYLEKVLEETGELEQGVLDQMAISYNEGYLKAMAS